MVQYGRPGCSSWAESVTVILWQDCHGKGNLRKSYWSTVGRRFPIGNAYSYTVKKGYSYLCMWMTSNWLERNKIIDPMWKVLNNEVDLGEPTSFLDHVYLGCTQRQCEISKDIVDNYQNHVWLQNFCRSNWEITMLGKSAYFSVVLWHGRPCEEMCRTILRFGKQDDSTTLQSINSVHRWPPLQRGGNKICWRIVNYLLSNCSQMLIFGKNWTTWYIVVSE